MQGQVITSTDVNREGRTFQSERFYRAGSLGEFAGFSKNPTFGDAGLIYSTPLYDADGKAIRGVLVLRAETALIGQIMESTPGFAEMETYLLDREYYPLTATRTLTQTVTTQASESILSGANLQNGRGTYENYTGETVLGYYLRVDALEAALIAEVPRSYILENSLRSLLGSAALALFAIVIAVAAVVMSAGSIAEPIVTLARTAENFAQGRFSARAAIQRRDEIGALGNAYDRMAEQLQNIIGKLEQRVADRTQDLQDQTLRLRISAEIARDAASSHSLDQLLDRAVILIQERFGLYHTGIFLLDNNHEYAVLAASPTPAGKQMIANNHRLRVGEVGIVGKVAATGEPRIMLDTGTDAVHFSNPLLPDTRSEMALPLKVENRLIGVLDVQSIQPQAFDENDIAIMQILADQLATAIERTRLLQQVEQNLSELEQAYGQFTREGWRTLGESGLLVKPGYRFDNIRIQPITEAPALGSAALRSGTTAIEKSNGSSPSHNQVAIPIRLRGQTIGVVTANLKDGYSPLVVSTLELAIERLALSLESARLYEEARLRADRERTIAQVTSNISAATEYDAILRTTVEEVGKSLSDTEVSIQILSDSDEASS
jgi:GAF domain-containing protein/HAMP domain-containing protein